MGERLARLHVAVEGEKRRAHGVLQIAVGHHHVEDRLRRDRFPHADGLEQPARRRHNRGCTGIARGSAEPGIGDGDGKGRPEPLAQRDRQREPGKSRAANQHIDTPHIARRKRHD